MSGVPVVRPAQPDELATVMSVVDAAMLETEASDVEAHLRAGDVLVAVDDDRVLGACVLVSERDATDSCGSAHVEAIAVRPGRRDQGIGRALIVAAADRHGRLTADFDERVRPFYASLGFSIEEDGERYVGRLDP